VSERLAYHSPEEERPLPKIEDFHYAYPGYYDDGGICRVRLFTAGERVPVIVVSQLAENRNTSITNMAEYLAAEIGAKHFPHRFEYPDPFDWIEQYSYPQERDPALRELWSRVRFDGYTPRLVTLGGVMRTKLGTPRWTHLAIPAVRRLIGAAEVADRGGEGPR
jgi:hypothetical protein